MAEPGSAQPQLVSTFVILVSLNLVISKDCLYLEPESGDQLTPHNVLSAVLTVQFVSLSYLSTTVVRTQDAQVVSLHHFYSKKCGMILKIRRKYSVFAMFVTFYDKRRIS